jgi:hypothetical protein
LREKDKN